MQVSARPRLLHACFRLATALVVSASALVGEVGAQTTTPTATPTPLPSVTPSGPLNHFQCYELERVRLTDPTPTPVTLQDPFVTATAVIQRPIRLCNPASKNGEDPTAPSDSDHLLGYKIKQINPRPARIANVVIQNQFATVVGDLVKPDWLFVPTAKSLDDPPPAPASPAVDHFKCYKIARFAKTRRDDVRVDDQFGQLFVDVKRPVRVCLAASKNGEPILDPDTHLMCYEVRKTPRLPRFQGPEPIFVNNQFGQPTIVTLTRPTELCVPSLVSLGCCGPVDRCIEADGTATSGHGIPAAVQVPLGAPLAAFPVGAPNNSGLGMFDNDGDAEWTFGFNGDDLHAEGATFCPTGVNDGIHQSPGDCVVLDINGSLFNGQPESCDLETGAGCTPPLPAPIKYHDANINNAWDDGEDIVLDVNANGICD